MAAFADFSVSSLFFFIKSSIYRVRRQLAISRISMILWRKNSSNSLESVPIVVKIVCQLLLSRFLSKQVIVKYKVLLPVIALYSLAIAYTKLVSSVSNTPLDCCCISLIRFSAFSFSNISSPPFSMGTLLSLNQCVSDIKFGPSNCILEITNFPPLVHSVRRYALTFFLPLNASKSLIISTAVYLISFFCSIFCRLDRQVSAASCWPEYVAAKGTIGEEALSCTLTAI